jgi:hypothetical protein
VLLALPGAMIAQPPPSNDECAGAKIVLALPYTDSLNTRLATPNPTDPILACADSGGGNTVWYTYTADSTHYVTFTTAGSTPSTYDVAMGLYTGSCGALVQVDCNDDINPGSIRQAEITFMVQSGVTYIIHVAEWKGGGPSGGVPTGGDLVFRVLNAPPPPPIVKGPKFGSLASGAVATTGAYAAESIPELPEKLKLKTNKPPIPLLPAPDDVMPPLAAAGTNYKEDRRSAQFMPLSSTPVILKNFQGNTPTGAIPPDPIMAVGPNHIIGMVNSSFKIWDKEGNLLKNISLDSWFSNVAVSVGFSDPQVHYDPNVHRWFMSGLGAAAPYHLLISVSDDDNPLGTWYNWGMLAGLGDSVTNNLPDYPQVGFDDSSIVITTRDFGTGFYSRVRILPKAQFLTNSAGPITWADYWDFREPQHPNVALDGIRPSFMYGNPGVHFLINASPYSLGTFFTVWTIKYPLTDSSITGQNVPVVEYSSSPNPSQLGGNTVLLEGGGSAIRHKAVYRDSSLWVVHSIASGTGGAYSAVRYVRLNPFTHTNLEDEAMGVEGAWHFYAALMVDGEKNVVVTYTRSSTSEYPGAYVSGRRNGDAPGLAPSVLIKAGDAHYEAVGGGRNRWGDYNGVGLDPSDSTSIWVNTEYAALPTDNWSTWIAQVKMGPIPGRFIYVNNTIFNFGPNEVGVPSDTLSFVATNNGLDSLTISSIALPDSHFVLVDPPAFPVKLGTFGSMTFEIAMLAQSAGEKSDTIKILSDDSVSPVSNVYVSGKGFIIYAAQPGVLYASSGATDGGRILSVNTNTAAATGIGASDYTQIINLRVRPTSNELVGLATNLAGPAGAYDIVRINALGGDAHPIANMVLSLVKGMAFHGDTLYAARINGTIYRVDMTTGATTLVASTGLQISGMDFHPVTGKLWLSVRGGANPDAIYKMNFPAGAPTLVGTTGFGIGTVDITFDGSGNLFGLVGTAPATNSLLLIDTTSGIGSLIGSMGIVSGQGLAMLPGTAFYTNTYRMMGKWNMISVPLSVPDYNRAAIFPTSVSKAYGYDGDFIQRDTLDNGSGFWLKFGNAAILSIIGSPVLADTFELHPKWNMVGSISEPVPVGMIASDPPGNLLTNYYAYGDSGYTVADTIYPGRGYWVKANATGELIVNAPAAQSRLPKPSEIRSYLASLNSLTISDGSGASQMLYFGREQDGGIARDQFGLPPAPPAGIFDARFASQSMVELHGAVAAEPADFPVIVSSATAPLRLSWNVSADAGVTYSALVRMKGAASVTTYALRGMGQAVLSGGAVADMRIRASEAGVPTAFALHQNYPNPFNPQTVIRYDLPENALVRLVVYDLLGREVATLVNQRQEAGYYTIPFMADNLSSGVYFYQLTAGELTQIQKMLLVR